MVTPNKAKFIVKAGPKREFAVTTAEVLVHVEQLLKTGHPRIEIESTFTNTNVKDRRRPINSRP